MRPQIDVNEESTSCMSLKIDVNEERVKKFELFEALVGSPVGSPQADYPCQLSESRLVFLPRPSIFLLKA
jgi:hypothetical protein